MDKLFVNKDLESRTENSFVAQFINENSKVLGINIDNEDLIATVAINNPKYFLVLSERTIQSWVYSIFLNVDYFRMPLRNVIATDLLYSYMKYNVVIVKNTRIREALLNILEQVCEDNTYLITDRPFGKQEPIDQEGSLLAYHFKRNIVDMEYLYNLKF